MTTGSGFYHPEFHNSTDLELSKGDDRIKQYCNEIFLIHSGCSVKEPNQETVLQLKLSLSNDPSGASAIDHYVTLAQFREKLKNPDALVDAGALSRNRPIKINVNENGEVISYDILPAGGNADENIFAK